MDCYACDQEATEHCSRCGNPYCRDHGADPSSAYGGSGQALCARCLDPANATPSSAVFRASLFALLFGSVLALWLIVRPPPLPGESTTVSVAPPTPTLSPVSTPVQISPSPSPAAEPALSTPSPEATPTPTPGPEAPIEYTVVEDDTLYGIAEAYGVSAEDLAAVNGLDLNDPIIQPGDVLVIPQ